MDRNELEVVKGFLTQTLKRITDLTNKVPKTRAEQFELEACLYDVRRAKKRIRELESGVRASGDQNDD